MKSLADVGPCAECKRPNCPTLLAQIHGTGGDKFTWRDRDEAEIGCLKAQLVVERARADAAERERDNLRTAARKIPIVRVADPGGSEWLTCAGCGAQDDADCAADCWVAALEDAIGD